MNCEKHIFRLLKIRPRSKKEILDKLLQKGCSKKDSLSKIAELEKQGYLKDEVFSKWWTEQRARSFRSRALIEQELLNKGVETDIIDQSFRELDIDDKKTIKKFIDHNLEKKDLNKEKEKIKIYRKLLAKGFSEEAISEFFDNREI